MVKQGMMTMVCLAEDGEYKLHALIIGNSIIFITIITIIALMVHMARKMHLFIIKHRAPILALAQCLLFLITLLAPYGVELTTYMGHVWDEHQVSVQRRLVKSLYIVGRSFCYAVFVLR